MSTTPQEGAIRDLSFIRDTMERSASFTAVSGWGGVAVGILGIVAAFVAWSQPTELRWLATWMVTSGLGLLITVVATAKKAGRLGIPVLSGAGRKFTIGMAPSLVAGTILTFVLFQNGLTGILPGVWLLLYGAGVVTAGITSITAIRLLGVCFMVVGTAALLVPAEWGARPEFTGIPRRTHHPLGRKPLPHHTGPGSRPEEAGTSTPGEWTRRLGVAEGPRHLPPP